MQAFKAHITAMGWTLETTTRPLGGTNRTDCNYIPPASLGLNVKRNAFRCGAAGCARPLVWAYAWAEAWQPAAALEAACGCY
jgi:hypothetical protein